MLFSNISVSKVINNEGEGYGSVFVGPDSLVGFNRLIYVILRVISLICHAQFFHVVEDYTCPFESQNILFRCLQF